MDIKIDLQQWNRACQAFDVENYRVALETLLQCRPSSKTFFNAGMILVTLHDYQHAIEAFYKAIEYDKYFSAAYFQLGVANVMMDDLENAIDCFNSAYKNLRGNRVINYRQLGLDFTLYACEVLYNRGICQLDLGNRQRGMEDLKLAQQFKMNHQHDIIDQVIKDPDHFTLGVYSIPPGIIYRLTKCQQQLLESVDALSILYQCDLRTTAAAQGLLILDHQYYDRSNSNTLQVYENHNPHQTCLPNLLTRYLPTTINKEKIGQTRMVSPTTPMTEQPTFAIFPPPPPSTSPAPPNPNHASSSSFKPRTPTDDHEKTGTLTGGETLKLKLHYKDTRILMVHAHSTFKELLVKSQEKLDMSPIKTNGLKLYYKGEDDQWTQITDDKGWSFAKNKKVLTTHQLTNKDKIDIWCTTG